MDVSLLQEFIAETGEHLDEMETNLLQLETDPNDREVLNNIFRAAHTIKGAAEYLGMEKMAQLSHKLENLLEILRHGEHSVEKELIEALISAKDRLGLLNDDLERGQTEETPIADIVERIELLAKGTPPENNKAIAANDIDASNFQEVIEPMLPDDMDSAQIVAMDRPPLAEDEDDDIYEEEYDDELFQIFIQHLQENLSLVRNQIKILPESDQPAEILQKCADYVNSLHSSANYMEYQKLTQMYESWLAEIETILEGITSGKTIDLADVASKMDRYAARIETRFAKRKVKEASETGDSEQLSTIQVEDLETLPEAEDMQEIQEASVVSSDFLLDTEDTGKELDIADEADVLRTQTPEEQELESVVVETTDAFDAIELPDMETVEAEDTDDQATEYQGLFDELDDVFDLGKSQPLKDAPVEYQGLFDELDDAFIASVPETKIKAVESLQLPVEEAIDDDVSTFESDEPMIEESADEKEAIIEEPAIHPSEQQESKPLQKPEKVVKHSLRVDARKIDSLMNQVGELVVSRAWFSQLYREMRELQMQLQEDGRLKQREMKSVRALTFKLSEATVALGRVANELQEGVMKVRMLPIAQLFNRYSRLVRDLIHGKDKKVRLEVIGEDTELDKMIIEEISDPLIHIIRNAVDHGFETATERKAAGKSEQGTLKLESYHESNHVVIEIIDDGRGIDTKLIKAKALKENLHTADELDRMSPRDLLAIVMKPGFSTANTVTTTSGRGVGMDVVKKNIEKLNGTIEIHSKVGVGTRFRIKIPLTLAIIRALLVRVGEEIFTIPLAAVEETLRIFEKDITMIEGIEVIHMRDSTLSLLRLTEIFNIRSTAEQDGKSFVVIVNTGMRQVGLVVDELIGQEEAVIKPLVDYLQESSGFSGATILGDGRISLILDVYELVNLSIGKQIKRKNLMMTPSLSSEDLVDFGAMASNVSYGNMTLH